MMKKYLYSAIIGISFVKSKVLNMKYALKNGIILDGSLNMEPIKDKTILVENDKIVAIVDANMRLEGYEAIDLKGQYIMPGLINLHVHLPSSGKPKKKETDAKKLVKTLTKTRLRRWIVLKLCESYAKMELKSGVTTMRTVGGVLDIDTKIRDRINEGKVLGPSILAANMAVSVPDGHMAGSLAYEAHNEDEARKFVKIIAKDKPDLIKLMITGGVLDAKVKGEPGELKMSPEIVKAACDEAHSLGMYVAAHVESPIGVRVALQNGVDTIEHGAKPDSEIIHLFKERKASHICTISPALPFALFDRSVSHATELSQYNGNVVFEGVLECAKECLKNDIPVGLGTDTGCPFITHYDMWREVNYFSKYVGVSKSFALYTATLGNAKIIGLDDKIGSITPGKLADMIVCQNNPLEDLASLRKLSYVIRNGVIIKNPKIKKMKKCEEELDKFL